MSVANNPLLLILLSSPSSSQRSNLPAIGISFSPSPWSEPYLMPVRLPGPSLPAGLEPRSTRLLPCTTSLLPSSIAIAPLIHISAIAMTQWIFGIVPSRRRAGHPVLYTTMRTPHLWVEHDLTPITLPPRYSVLWHLSIIQSQITR